MTIIGMDPGISTGVALLNNIDEIGTQTLKGNLAQIYTMLNMVKPTAIAFEDFKFRPQMMKAETYSLEVKGVVKKWAEQHNVEMFLYLPATAKAFWTDQKIKKLGLWKPGHIHEMDALRVLLTHRTRTEPDWFKEIVNVIR